MSFQSLGLSTEIVEQLSTLNISEPTPIQSQAIPHVLDRRDILASAQTGTGKTAAFGLPIIQQCLDAKNDGAASSQSPYALILTPTRELAQQVYDNLISYNQDLRIVSVYGGVSINVQTRQLKQGVDIVVATPGRLLDHLFVGNLQIKETQTLVLDEADRMMDMGFMPDLQRILRRMSQEKQTLFFSATFTDKIKKMAYSLLNDPIEIQISPENSTAERVEQMVYPVNKSRKKALLAYLIGSRNWQQVLVFTKTKETSDVLAKELKLDGIKAVSINGDKSQGARQKALDEFKSGKVRALIATDVAARGLDIQQLPCVINYELPFKAEDYVHRIGRTGRAGESGYAVSLMCPQEQYLLDAIETLLDTRLPQEWLAGFEPTFEEEEPTNKRSRSSEKRKMKAKLNIHSGRGKRR